MMFGYADDWWVLFLCPVLLWVPFGPFLMGAAGRGARPGPGGGRACGRYCSRWCRWGSPRP